MSQLNLKVPLICPQTQTQSCLPLPNQASQGHCIAGKEIAVCSSARLPVPPSMLSWAGLPQSPAPPAVSPRSPVLNPKPRGTPSWPAGKSPFTPFLPAWSHVVLQDFLCNPIKLWCLWVYLKH